MNIRQRLALSDRSDKIVLIEERLFYDIINNNNSD